VLDIHPGAVEALTSQGAQAAESVASLAANSDVLFTSLPSSVQVEQVAYGDDGILANAKAELCWFETSTNNFASWQQVLAEARSDLTLIDAPVTGGAEGAAAGRLTMLLGTEQPPFTELLASFTKKVVPMGPAGAGYACKLIQLHLNYLVAEGIGEALMLGAKAGIDLNVLSQVLSNSCAQSYVVDSYIPKVLNGSYDTSFALGLAHKDMSLICQLAEQLAVKMPLGEQVMSDYNQALEAFGFDAPHLSIVKLLEEQQQQTLRA